MFTSPSSLTPSSTISASGFTLRNFLSSRAFSDLFPLSTLSDTRPDQSSALSRSFLPGSRSQPPSVYSSAMSLSGGVRHIGVVDAVYFPKELSTPSTDTGSSTGTSPSPSSASNSNSDISVAPTLRSTTSRTYLTSPLAISSSLYLSPSIDSSSMSGTASTPDASIPTETQTYSSATTASSFPSFSASSPESPQPSPIIPTSSIPSTFSQDPSSTPNLTTTVVSSTTVLTSVSQTSSLLTFPPASTYTITSEFPAQQVTTYVITSSSVLSTQSPGSAIDSTVHLSPGAIAGIVLGLVGAFAFAGLWLFCVRRRQSKLVQEAAFISHGSHSPRRLDEEVRNMIELGHEHRSTRSIANPTSSSSPVMEERYAGILAALHVAEGFGKCDEAGSTGAMYGSRHDILTDMDMDDNDTRVSSPTLAVHGNHSDDQQYIVPLSPPPHVSPSSHHPTPHPTPYPTPHPTPPPSSYNMAARRRSSPGPDAVWGGYSAAPSSNSHYARSQTLGSGSRSGSVDALSRTRTGSEEPLLGICKATTEVSPSITTPESVTFAAELGGNRLGLGSAFGSPPGSTYSPSGAYSLFHHDSTGSRSASGSGSYGYASSGTPSSFDALRRVSSQGALPSAQSHGHGQGFKFAFGRGGSLSSGSPMKKIGNHRHSLGAPPTSFRAWKDRGTAGLDNEKLGEKPSVKEKDWKQKRRSMSSISTSGSTDGRGSPALGVRALLDRLRRAGHTPSPRSSIRDVPSPRRSMDVDPELGVGCTTPPPILIQAATPQRPRRYSFILSNPDPHPPSPYSGAGDVPASDTSPRPVPREVLPCDIVPGTVNVGGLVPGTPIATRYALVHAPSPVPTEESRLVEGLLHPRLQTQGHSDASLRDFEDYSRPIAGVVKNRLYSTTTFATQDSDTRTPARATPVHDDEHEEMDVFGASMFRDVPRDSWFFEDLTPRSGSPLRD